MEVFWERSLFVIISALIGTCVTLFVRVRMLESKRAAADVRLDHLEKAGDGGKAVNDLSAKIGQTDGALQQHRLDCERRFVSRDDWVPVNSSILGNLEKQRDAISEQGKAIARIEAGMNGSRQ